MTAPIDWQAKAREHEVSCKAFTHAEVYLAGVAAGMAEAARITLSHPDSVLQFWDRPGGPPGNGWRATKPADIASAIRNSAPKEPTA